MKSKIIIHNETTLPDETVLTYIQTVVSGGLVSETKQGKQYCFVTTFKSGYVVTCVRKNNTFTFKIFYKE